jgi:outer membrane protein assembly factor BamB
LATAGEEVTAPPASTGLQLWNFQTGAAVDSSPAVANGMVYVGSEEGNVYALNASTGAQLWSYNTEAAPAIRPHQR